MSAAYHIRIEGGFSSPSDAARLLRWAADRLADQPASEWADTVVKRSHGGTPRQRFDWHRRTGADLPDARMLVEITRDDEALRDCADCHAVVDKPSDEWNHHLCRACTEAARRAEEEEEGRRDREDEERRLRRG
jgi:hypothetical protein